MKRNEEKVPGFDEIVFENRNKAYGAYVLRKSYKLTACLSTLGAVLLTVILVLALSFNTKKVSSRHAQIVKSKGGGITAPNSHLVFVLDYCYSR